MIKLLNMHEFQCSVFLERHAVMKIHKIILVYITDQQIKIIQFNKMNKLQIARV